MTAIHRIALRYNRGNAMHLHLEKNLLLAMLLHGVCAAAFAASAIATRVEDPKAVYLAPPDTSGRAGEPRDDSAAIQAAIDKAENNVREGIVFVPSGRYRLTRTVYVWPGVRVFGYGADPSGLPAAGQHAGFSERHGRDGDVHRSACRPQRRQRLPRTVSAAGQRAPNSQIADANSGTFYSAMSNIDFEIGDGNPAAVAIRFHVAQHAYLSHMDFHIGSGLAALNADRQ